MLVVGDARVKAGRYSDGADGMNDFKTISPVQGHSESTRSAAVVGRFAPTPSGRLHAGSLLAALGSFLSARAQGGRWLLRIEDLDPPREVAGAAQSFVDDLQRLGLHWDGEVLYQSRRGEAYATALAQLRQAGLAFPCACSRQDLAPSGIHRGDCVRVGRAGGHAWRLRVGEGCLQLEDRHQGCFAQDLDTEVGDFVLRRRDGYWAYHLAVVVDDAEQSVSEVVRGADLLDSTPRQMLLQKHLRLPTPAYAHLPVLLDESGAKLSKSQGATDLRALSPLQALRQALEWLGQPVPEGESCEALLARAIRDWDPAGVPPQRSMPCRMRAVLGREQTA